jgi:hypothetical protein
MRTFVLCAAAASALLVSAPTGAKELVKAELCGPAGCVAVDKDELRLVPLEGDEFKAPPPLGAFHNLRLTAQDGRDAAHTTTWTIWYVPSAGMIAFRNESNSVTFHSIKAVWAKHMEELAKRVQPFPAPRIMAAFVDGRRVDGDPATYARLFTAESVGAAGVADSDWVQIALRSSRPTPWTFGTTASFSPSARVLQLGPKWIRLADGLSDDLANARALGADGRATLLPWLTLAALLVAVALLAVLGAWLRRRPDAVAAPEPLGDAAV